MQILHKSGSYLKCGPLGTNIDLKKKSDLERLPSPIICLVWRITRPVDFETYATLHSYYPTQNLTFQILRWTLLHNSQKMLYYRVRLQMKFFHLIFEQISRTVLKWILLQIWKSEQALFELFDSPQKFECQIQYITLGCQKILLQFTRLCFPTHIFAQK